jgi:hypothetical protein
LTSLEVASCIVVERRIKRRLFHFRRCTGEGLIGLGLAACQATSSILVRTGPVLMCRISRLSLGELAEGQHSPNCNCSRGVVLRNGNMAYPEDVDCCVPLSEDRSTYRRRFVENSARLFLLGPPSLEVISRLFDNKGVLPSPIFKYMRPAVSSG